MQEEKLIQLSEGNFLSHRKLNKILEQESPSELRERAKNIRLHLNKMPTLPFESPPEKSKRKTTLRRLLGRIDTVINEKETKLKVSQAQTIEEWIGGEVPTHFISTHVLRYATGSQVDALRTGSYHLEHVKWLPIIEEEITIKTQQGRTLVFNVLKQIHAKVWKEILATPFTPYFFNLEKNVISVKDGKPQGIWDHPKDYAESKKLKPVTYPMHIAIMTV